LTIWHLSTSVITTVKVLLYMFHSKLITYQLKQQSVLWKKHNITEAWFWKDQCLYESYYSIFHYQHTQVSLYTFTAHSQPVLLLGYQIHHAVCRY